MILMGRILAFSFSWVLVTSRPSFQGCHANQLPFVMLPVFLSISVTFGLTFFHRKVCSEVLSSVPLKPKTRVFLWKKHWYQWFRTRGHIQTQLYLKKKPKARLASMLAHVASLEFTPSPSIRLLWGLGSSSSLKSGSRAFNSSPASLTGHTKV